MSENLGWISLHRSIQNHWLFQEDRKFSKFEAWIDLILIANHKDGKVMHDGQLIDVKRGQKLTSLRKLGNQWNWSITKVDKFLNILHEDGMIVLKKDTKKTLVTIVNYDVYQNIDLEKRQRSDTKKNQKEIKKESEKKQKETNNNVNKANKDNNVNNPQSVSDEDFKKIADYYNKTIQALNGTDYVHLGEDVEKFGKELVCKAIQEAARNSAQKYSYINRVLIDWSKNGVKTKEDAEQYLLKRQHNFNNKNKWQKEDEHYSPYQDMEFAEIPDDSLPF
ncbi:DnaD domain protein [Mammaliicoccus sp. Dog046]|uniref:DnaD domain-containing protein n=1 Tax=Mammaliicoccus sp. Dog046 TaxID=3034233 RepID=UPI002B2597E2|nr:DnaD domain protein [Mammaliicoccus sp. Dog046]WQK85433.1 DnaD domain protein [Mammaliicoccus sp. Dog046]